MKVYISNDNSSVIDIRFTYCNNNKFRITKCVISKVDLTQDGKNKYCAIAEGESRCMKHDKFNKSFGRKLSLIRAIANANELINDREIRKKIWKEYEKNCPNDLLINVPKQYYKQYHTIRINNNSKNKD